MIPTLENTIYFGCAAYSGIFPNRGAILNHLFCVNGTGYEWVKGQLVYDGDRRYRGKTVEDAIKAHFEWQRKKDAERKEAERHWRREYKKRQAARDPKEIEVEEKKFDAALEKAIEETKQRHASMTPEQIKAEQERLDEACKKATQVVRRMKYYQYRVPGDIQKRIKDTKYNNWYPMSHGYCRLLDFPADIRLDWWLGLVETCHLIIAQPNFVDRNHPQAMADHNQEIAREALDKAHEYCYNRVKYSRQFRDDVLLPWLREYKRWPKALNGLSVTDVRQVASVLGDSH